MSFVQHFATTADWCDLGQMTIDMLPDEVVLEIFDFYRLQTSGSPFEGTGAWHTLVHVCRHWRMVVFGSPLRLNLQLLCTAKTPVKETLDVWPALPIRVQNLGPICQWGRDVDNISDVLKHSDRICEIILHHVPNRLLQDVLAALMLEPFPLLTNVVVIASNCDRAMSVPRDIFSAGPAQCLRKMRLEGFSLPALPGLFLCATVTHLVHLALLELPHARHMSPEATATSLSAMTNLEFLQLDFQTPRSHPIWWVDQRPRPPTRSLFPSLTTFGFHGVCGYLEDFVARIDAPRLNLLSITFFNHFVFETSQLASFITRTPSFRDPNVAHVSIRNRAGVVSFSSRTPGFGVFNVKVPCPRLFSQLPSLVQVCSSFSPPLSTVENLFIHKPESLQELQSDCDTENAEWLKLLRSFTAVNNLYIYELFVPRILAALGGPEGIPEVLPVLRYIFKGDV